MSRRFFHVLDMHAILTLIHLLGFIYFWAIRSSHVQNKFWSTFDFRCNNRKWSKINFSFLKVDQSWFWTRKYSENRLNLASGSNTRKSLLRILYRIKVYTPEYVQPNLILNPNPSSNWIKVYTPVRYSDGAWTILSNKHTVCCIPFF